MNRRKDAVLAAMSTSEKNALTDLGTLEELSDADPRFKYMT